MNYAKATTVRLSGEPTDDAQRKADERMRHDYPILQRFHSKHALGALAAPSCLCCGQQTGPARPIAVQHMELPAIVICKPCKDAAAGVAAVPAGDSMLERAVRGMNAVDEGHDPLCMAVLRGKECTCGVDSVAGGEQP